MCIVIQLLFELLKIECCIIVRVLTISLLLFVGVEQLKEYKKEVDHYESERQELANAERLFDLPITMYPELLQVQKEMKGLEQIYALYEEQKVKAFSV